MPSVAEPASVYVTVVAVLLAALNVTVNWPSSGPASEPSPFVDLATLAGALSLSVMFRLACHWVSRVMFASPVTPVSVTVTVSVASTKPSSVTSISITAVVVLAAIVTLWVTIVA